MHVWTYHAYLSLHCHIHDIAFMFVVVDGGGRGGGGGGGVVVVSEIARTTRMTKSPVLTQKDDTEPTMSLSNRHNHIPGADHIILKGGFPNFFSGTDHGLGTVGWVGMRKKS